MVRDLIEYRASEAERVRTDDLIGLLPRNRRSVLDVGARDGHFSRILTGYFYEVVALDLERPSFECERVRTVAGDVTRLAYPDDHFDCVFCAEVLEHIPDLQRACSELVRVARYEVIIGVPYRQDTRVGRTTCQACGKSNPPWGHVNSFTEESLAGLFPGLPVVSKSFVGNINDGTNAVSTFMMDLAGNPWGTYDQDEPCIHCGAHIVAPAGERSLWRKVCSALALRVNQVQAHWLRPHPNWIHLVFSKRGDGNARNSDRPPR